ncbi:reverse transcriptase domain-containing protein [Hafnia alvei]|uniref:reverse transcriptase domain-containing protein n=1 Tax=Hafnia alvei TaxID=569 RepID=UPI0010339E6A|nr:reverse transcriptase domain-containing protein [Hafnia alvei]TBM19596.1 RNA-directed DNA polymerase [Hafnia alvei]VTQ67572.1 Retron-type reverse transcriptase [Campylobacter jejuni]
MDTFFPFNTSPKYKIENNKELAALLGITTAKLTYYAYYLSDDDKYHSFKIRKRINGERLIEAPNRGLKDIQKTISHFLERNYTPRSCVFAYVKERDIVEHASIHVGQRWLLRLDLKDFFHSISSARVSGVLRRAPFCFAKSPANTVARLCTKDGRLPQGSPASPVISNILCKGLDYKLKQLASSNKCYYTRYADDIFISNNGSVFPSAIAIRGDDGNVELSEAIKNIIINSGFEVNAGKTTLRKKSERQLVTGVVVNKKTNIPKEYIKSIRAGLYAWEKFGLDAAEEYWKKEIERSNKFDAQPPQMRLVIRGKIIHVGHVKGYTDATFLTLVRRLQALDSEFKIDEQKFRREITDEIHIYTEGVTDTKHFQAALNAFQKRGEFLDLKIIFKNSSKPGSASLKTLCENLRETSQKHLTLCIFDRDEKNIVNEMSGSPGNYRDHGNNVFSLIIPIPEFRKGNDSICIEHLYQDSLLFTCDSEGRRLYFKDEFDNLNCHKTDPNLFCRISKSSLVYDDNVINLSERKNVALPKNKFADYVCSGQPPFNNVDYGGFYEVFKQILEIASTYNK